MAKNIKQFSFVITTDHRSRFNAGRVPNSSGIAGHDKLGEQSGCADCFNRMTVVLKYIDIFDLSSRTVNI